MMELDGRISYADSAWQGAAAVQQNVRLARDTYRIRFACPQIAGRMVPGQFVMMRISGLNDPLLGRPMAIFDVVADADGRPHWLDVVYLIVGKMTRLLAAVEPGTQIELWGPLGNGFGPSETEHLVMVAGGIGLTPFLTLAREYLGLQSFGDPPRAVPRARQVTLCYGARTAEHLAGVDDFRRAGVEVQLSTDDGSTGHHGLVTELIRPVVQCCSAASRIVCCGPEPMMRATAEIARQLVVPCQVSLETPMACGMGICFSCVAKIRDASGRWDYRRTCVEGPVFDAEDVEFNEK